MGYFIDSVVLIAAILCASHSNAQKYEAHFESQNILATSSNTSCCAVLRASLGEEVGTRGTKKFDDAIDVHWSALVKEAIPACVVQPRSAVEVAVIIQTLRAQYSAVGPRPEDCLFAVRGGGHATWKGAANIDGGVLIDMSALNSVVLSEDRSTVAVGSGATWGEVYSFLDNHELAVVGGRVNHVGVAGLTLGGGISFFSPRYGFVCDNVESFELVLADGSIDTVSSTDTPDLFRALKGGSNNFGIVTNFRLRTFPSGPFWGGLTYHGPEASDQQLVEVTKLAGSEDYDTYAAVIATQGWSSQGKHVINVLSYTQVPAKNEIPEALSGFARLEPQLANTTRVAPLTWLTEETAPSKQKMREMGVPDRVSFATMTYKNNLAFARAFIESAEIFATDLQTTVQDVAISVGFQPLPPSITAKQGENVLGFKAEDGALVNILVNVYWSQKEDDEFVEQRTKKLLADAREKAKEMDVYHRAIYLNYAEKWQDPIGGYGEENLKFLRRVSEKYDPEGFWQKGMPGGFKLWKEQGSG